jgi:FlaG/FlaF family flagellin (archaellin)
VILIVEGKKRRELYPDCQAVSEVYGEMLMISIVVIAFSTIAVTVFSDEGVVKPEHIPHTDLQENFNLSTNKIQIVHSGGEAIDKSAIKIIVNVNNGEKRGEFKNVSPKRPDGTVDNVFALGDSIQIDTTSMNLKAGDDIVMHFIDTPSQQVIHTAVLQRGSGGVPNWITPHPYGSVYSNSTYDGGWQPTEPVAEKYDGIRTNSFIPLGAQVTENYTFGIDAGEIGILNSFNSVILQIIYQVTGDILGTPILSISTNDADWITLSQTSPNTYDISPYVKTARDLENLKVSFSAEGLTNGTLQVDFVGIQVN